MQRASDAQQWEVWLEGTELFTHHPHCPSYTLGNTMVRSEQLWGLALRDTASLAVLPLTPVLIHTSSYFPDL